MIEEFKNPRAWIEIALLAVTFYFILNFIRGTRGAGILKGIVFLFSVAFLGLMYVADRLELERIRDMLRWVLSGSALAIIILFAPELRRGLSHLAQSPLLSPLLRGPSSKVVDELVDAAVKLSKNRIGALVAIERDVGLGEYVENGTRLDAQLTSELLETIFYPGSALHDGAVIVQHDRVAAAGCLLPLTDDMTLSKSLGTRHRAALGISEETDAVALVVSEETGRISLAVNGKLLTDLTRESLERLLNDFLARADRATLPFRRTPSDNGGAPAPGPAEARGAELSAGKTESPPAPGKT
ncbi:MAG TPA: diadenylate cyclase CdaA [Planctomycetota bacterium]|nr:diadenylate cyclase CdaA [Planctomycetota bacterium]